MRKITEFHVNTLAMRAIFEQLQIVGLELPNKETVCYYGYNDELEYNKLGLLVPASAIRGAVVSGKLTIPFGIIVGIFEYEVQDGATQRPIGFETGQ